MAEQRIGHHPGFGCLIFAGAALMFIGVAVWSFYTLSKQDSAIAKFTVSEEVKTQIAEPDPGVLEELTARVKAFADGAMTDERTVLTLSPDDINHLLLIYPSLNDYKGIVWFREIGDDGMLAADFALPMNQMRFWKGRRYLDATGHLELSYEPAEFRMYLRIHDLAARQGGEEIPEGFIYNFEHWLWLTPYYEEDETKVILLKITELDFADGKVTIVANGERKGGPVKATPKSAGKPIGQ